MVAMACLPAAVSLLFLEALFMQISGVSLALTWPCRLFLLRVLLSVSLCYKLSPFQAHWERWHCTCFLRPVCLVTVHVGSGLWWPDWAHYFRGPPLTTGWWAPAISSEPSVNVNNLGCDPLSTPEPWLLAIRFPNSTLRDLKIWLSIRNHLKNHVYMALLHLYLCFY
jgi:hypothetical protein